MSNDPIINELSIRSQRILWFCGLVCATTLFVWYCILHWWFGYENNLRVLWDVTRLAWQLTDHHTSQLLFLLCAALALMAITNLYLVIALWWKRRGTIHHRGTRVIDRREVQR